MRTLVFVALVSAVTACSSATYRVEDPTTMVNGKPKVVAITTADAPGGDTFAIVAYYGKTVPATIKAGADSTALVNATAAAGQAAVSLALKAAK